jgi:hypothetical protein
VNRKVYAVCYTGIDTLGAFHDARFMNARRSYFESGKTVHIARRGGIYDGLSGEVRGKLSRRTIKWEKTAQAKRWKPHSRAAVSAASRFGTPTAHCAPACTTTAKAVDAHGVLCSDDDAARAFSFKPDDTRDAVHALRLQPLHRQNEGDRRSSPCPTRSKPPSRVCKTPSAATMRCC